MVGAGEDDGVTEGGHEALFSASYVDVQGRRAREALGRVDEKAYKEALPSPAVLWIKASSKRTIEGSLSSKFLMLHRWGQSLKARRKRIEYEVKDLRDHENNILATLERIAQKEARIARRHQVALAIWKEWADSCCGDGGSQSQASSPFHAICHQKSGLDRLAAYLQRVADHLLHEEAVNSIGSPRSVSSQENPSEGNDALSSKCERGGDVALWRIWSALHSLLHSNDGTDLQGTVTPKDATTFMQEWLHVDAEGDVADRIHATSPVPEDLVDALEIKCIRLAQGSFDHGLISIEAFDDISSWLLDRIQEAHWEGFSSSEEGIACLRQAVTLAFDVEKSAGIQHVITDDIEHGRDEDLWIDTDLLHAGISQRVQVTSLKPHLGKMLTDTKAKIAVLLGEQSVLVQCIFSAAAIPCQCAIRGWLVRQKAEKMWSLFWEDVVHAAAAQIQKAWMQHHRQAQLKAAKFKLVEADMIYLQAHARGWLTRKRIETGRQAAMTSSVYALQPVIRGWLGRLRARRLRLTERWTRNILAFEWAAITVQTCARRYLAKKMLRSKKIDAGLTARLSKLADTYLMKGDLWTFLQQINSDYLQYERMLHEMEVKENNLASTFFDKVVQRREDDLKAAWGLFRAVSRGNGAHNATQRNSPYLNVTPSARQSGPFRSQRLSPARSCGLPSARLRAATASDVDGIRDRSVQPHSRTRSAKKLARSTLRPKDCLLSRGRPASSEEGWRIGTAGSIHALYDDESSGAILLGGEGTNESSIIDQSDSRLADWEKKWDEMVDERGRSRAGVGRFPGASAIRDVPGGIDDILSRFLNAVFLRSHVPSCMPKETTAKEAFLHYTSLPPSLVKVRHEQEAIEAAEPFLHKFQSKGFKIVRHLLPASKAAYILRKLDMPETAVGAAVSLLNDLKRARVGSNRLSASSRDKYRKLRPRSLLPAISLGDAISNTLGYSNREFRGEWDPTRYLPDDQPKPHQPPPSILPKRYDETLHVFVPKNLYNFDNIYGRMVARPSCHQVESCGSIDQGTETARTANTDRPFSEILMSDKATMLFNALYCDSHRWGTLDGPIEDIMLHAAFYTCENPSPPTEIELSRAKQYDAFKSRFGVASSSTSTKSAVENLHVRTVEEGTKSSFGIEGFKAFIVDLDAASSKGADVSRQLILRRHEASGVCSRQLIDRLLKDGIDSVRKLSSARLSDWDLPDAIIDEVQRMIGVMITSQCAMGYSRITLSAGRSAGGKRRKKRARVPDFDPRYQRSALDPFGRPPRVGRILPLPKPVSWEAQLQLRSAGAFEEVVDPPSRMWDHGGGGLQHPQKESRTRNAHGQFMCRFEGCKERFRQLAVLIKHEKFHETFPEYQRYIHAPQVGVDDISDLVPIADKALGTTVKCEKSRSRSSSSSNSHKIIPDFLTQGTKSAVQDTSSTEPVVAPKSSSDRPQRRRSSCIRLEMSPDGQMLEWKHGGDQGRSDSVPGEIATPENTGGSPFLVELDLTEELDERIRKIVDSAEDLPAEIFSTLVKKLQEMSIDGEKGQSPSETPHIRMSMEQVYSTEWKVSDAKVVQEKGTNACEKRRCSSIMVQVTIPATLHSRSNPAGGEEHPDAQSVSPWIKFGGSDLFLLDKHDDGSRTSGTSCSETNEEFESMCKDDLEL